MNQLPRIVGRTPAKKPSDTSIHFSPLLTEVARLEQRDVFVRMQTSLDGLSEDAAASRLKEVGLNVVAASQHQGWPWRLLIANACSPPPRRVPRRSSVRPCCRAESCRQAQNFGAMDVLCTDKTGTLTMDPLSQEVIDVLAVFNALRAAIRPKELTDFGIAASIVEKAAIIPMGKTLES